VTSGRRRAKGKGRRKRRRRRKRVSSQPLSHVTKVDGLYR
jgi:hypothetical protein